MYNENIICVWCHQDMVVAPQVPPVPADLVSDDWAHIAPIGAMPDLNTATPSSFVADTHATLGSAVDTLKALAAAIRTNHMDVPTPFRAVSTPATSLQTVYTPERTTHVRSDAPEPPTPIRVPTYAPNTFNDWAITPCGTRGRARQQDSPQTTPTQRTSLVSSPFRSGSGAHIQPGQPGPKPPSSPVVGLVPYLLSSPPTSGHSSPTSLVSPVSQIIHPLALYPFSIPARSEANLHTTLMPMAMSSPDGSASDTRPQPDPAQIVSPTKNASGYNGFDTPETGSSSPDSDFSLSSGSTPAKGFNRNAMGRYSF